MSDKQLLEKLKATAENDIALAIEKGYIQDGWIDSGTLPNGEVYVDKWVVPVNEIQYIKVNYNVADNGVRFDEEDLELSKPQQRKTRN